MRPLASGLHCVVRERLIFAKAQEPRARTTLGLLSPLYFPSRALPAPHSGAHTYSGVGEWVSSKKPPLVVFPAVASPRVIFAAMEGSRFVRRWRSRALNRFLQT